MECERCNAAKATRAVRRIRPGRYKVTGAMGPGDVRYCGPCAKEVAALVAVWSEGKLSDAIQAMEA